LPASESATDKGYKVFKGRPSVEGERAEALTEFEAEGRTLEAIEAVSSADGRYRRITERLAPYFSEKALISHRIEVESKYLVALSEVGVIRPLTEEEREMLRDLPDISTGEANMVKQIEVNADGVTLNGRHYDKTDHDVKSVEIFMKEKLRNTSLGDTIEMIHFALTSEDVNNLSYALMMSRATEKVMLPEIEKVIAEFNDLADEHVAVAMLARTHGQPATPTVFGKEMAVFAGRMARQAEQLRNHSVTGKLNGATGTYSAHVLAAPEVDWPAFSRRFVETLNEDNTKQVEWNPLTTQVEPHDSYAELFDNYKRLNNALVDGCKDLWDYIKDNWIKQTPKDAESGANVSGSSTMPNKVNPIKFENGEGNLQFANSQFVFLGDKLTTSRRQRDLSDSTVERGIGEPFAKTLVALDSVRKGFAKIKVDEKVIDEELAQHPEVITEGIQTVMRMQGIEDAYDKTKEFTQGKPVTAKLLREFIRTQGMDPEVEEMLLRLEPKDYIGLAIEITKDHLARERERLTATA
jgi:adenylosuccinate lyase